MTWAPGSFGFAGGMNVPRRRRLNTSYHIYYKIATASDPFLRFSQTRLGKMYNKSPFSVQFELVKRTNILHQVLKSVLASLAERSGLFSISAVLRKFILSVKMLTGFRLQRITGRSTNCNDSVNIGRRPIYCGSDFGRIRYIVSTAPVRKKDTPKRPAIRISHFCKTTRPDNHLPTGASHHALPAVRPVVVRTAAYDISCHQHRRGRKIPQSDPRSGFLTPARPPTLITSYPPELTPKPRPPSNQVNSTAQVRQKAALKKKA